MTPTPIAAHLATGRTAAGGPTAGRFITGRLVTGAVGSTVYRHHDPVLGTVEIMVLDPESDADRIVIEPDARNDRALRRVEVMGFGLGPEIDLPGKTGRLAALTRERWQSLAASLG